MHKLDEILHQAAVPDTVTDDDLRDLRQEVVRDVTAVLMFGARPAPEGRFSSTVDRAEADLRALSATFLYSDDAAAHLTRIADEPMDADGALHFGCLLNVARHPDGALWWWQFAAGAGNATAAHCLHLFHLGRGELRDADHWRYQADLLRVGAHPAPLRLPDGRPGRWPDSHTEALREEVDRLKVDDVDGTQVHHPDHRLADRIEELADAC